jgi:hypothetical protein
MNRRRDLLFVVLLLGWRQEAALGLAVLLFLDLFVFLRGRQARSDEARSSEGTDGEDESSVPGEGEEHE